MKSCKKCGAELPDKAVICTECGEIQSKDNSSASDDEFFSMPYLSASASVNSKPNTDDESDTKNESPSSDDEKLTDPLERAYRKRDKRNKIIRIIALILVCAIIISTGAYFLFRSKGYYRKLDMYIDGRLTSGGTKYLSIVPDLYLINAESVYDMTRPEIKSTTGNYLQYVKDQLVEDYGSDISMSYKITSERTTDDRSSLSNIENSVLSEYSTEITISEAAYVNIRLTTKGSITQSSENMSLTFYKYDGKWYSLDAMEIIQFACENAGYNLW